MKLLVLFICLGYAMASEKLLDELDKLLASKIETADPSTDAEAEELMKQLVESLKVEEEDGKPSLDEGLPSLYGSRFLDDDNQLYKRLSSPREPEYGYCFDGVTPAEGPNQQGCSRALCYDKMVGQCNRDFANEIKMTNTFLAQKLIKAKCSRGYHTFRDRCPHTCRYCKSPSPEKTCKQKYNGAKYGCCKVGGFPALKKDKSDCPPCRDFYAHVCGQFMSNRFGLKCDSNSYRIRTFLGMQCPLSCGRCKRGEF